MRSFEGLSCPVLQVALTLVTTGLSDPEPDSFPRGRLTPTLLSTQDWNIDASKLVADLEHFSAVHMNHSRWDS